MEGGILTSQFNFTFPSHIWLYFTTPARRKGLKKTLHIPLLLRQNEVTWKQSCSAFSPAWEEEEGVHGLAKSVYCDALNQLMVLDKDIHSGSWDSQDVLTLED